MQSTQVTCQRNIQRKKLTQFQNKVVSTYKILIRNSKELSQSSFKLYRQCTWLSLHNFGAFNTNCKKSRRTDFEALKLWNVRWGDFPVNGICCSFPIIDKQPSKEKLLGFFGPYSFPDRPFHNFEASKSVAQLTRILLYADVEALIFLKGSVGRRTIYFWIERGGALSGLKICDTSHEQAFSTRPTLSKL